MNFGFTLKLKLDKCTFKLNNFGKAIHKKSNFAEICSSNKVTIWVAGVHIMLLSSINISKW